MFFVVTNSEKTYKRFNKRNRSEINLDFQSRLGRESLDYVDAQTLVQMQGVPSIFRKHFCGLDHPDLVDADERARGDTDMLPAAAEELCEWANNRNEKGITKLEITVPLKMTLGGMFIEEGGKFVGAASAVGRKGMASPLKNEYGK